MFHLLTLSVVVFATVNPTLGSEGFRDSVSQMVERQAKWLTKLKTLLRTSLKSWVIVEPTERETRDADRAMDLLFAVGSPQLVDTMEKMDLFCREREALVATTSAWIIRRFTFDFNVRLLMSLIVSRMERKTDLYCADETLRRHYVEFTRQLRHSNQALTAIRSEFVDTLVRVHHSHVGITKVDDICCAFWRYRNQTLEGVAAGEVRLFVADMMDSFFGGGLRFLCLVFQEESAFCPLLSPHTPDPRVPHAYDSLVMNLVLAASKVSDVLLKR